MRIEEALAYARSRLGDVRVELITAPDGYVNGCVFKAGRSKTVFGHDIEARALSLWVDCVLYGRNKAQARRAGK